MTTWGKIRAALRAAPARGAAAPTAAVAVILTAGLELLLIKRSEHPLDRWSGQMALPGGRFEAVDADLLATARRETREETGIDLASAELLGELDDLVSRSPSAPQVVVRPFVFGIPGRLDLEPSGEVAGHLWVPLKELEASAGTAEVAIRDKSLRVEAYLVSEPPVWGMTHRILSGLMARIL